MLSPSICTVSPKFEFRPFGTQSLSSIEACGLLGCDGVQDILGKKRDDKTPLRGTPASGWGRKKRRKKVGRKEGREEGSKLEEAALQSQDHCEEMFKQEDWT